MSSPAPQPVDWPTLVAAFESSQDPAPLLAGRAALVDQLVCARSATLWEILGPEAALLAVGGYGRRELYPHSDIDLLVLLPKADPPAAVREALAFWLRDLWDAGLRLSHSTRTVAECGRLHENNTELHISLLDSRLLFGSEQTFSRLQQTLTALLDRHRRALQDRLLKLTATRHARFQNTFHHLEPDVKEGPGGLRDAHCLRWLAQLSNSQSAVPHGAVHELQRLRCSLHLAENRDANVLRYELQDRILPDPAAGMRAYYLAANTILRHFRDRQDEAEARASGIWGQLRDRQERLSNAEFTVLRGRILLRTQTVAQTKAGLWRLFQFAGRHALTFAPETARQVRTALAAWSFTSEWADWEALLKLPHAATAVRLMAETGALAAVLPEWSRVEGTVVRDFHHRYTVDEHTLVTLEIIDQLQQTPPLGDDRFAGLLAEEPDRAILRLALLLHDLGKGSGDHVAIARQLLPPRLAAWNVPGPERDLILWLVDEHLLLSETLAKRDLNDPETGIMLAAAAGTTERLRLLTLFTFADSSAVHPHAMTAWRAEQLWRVWRAGARALATNVATQRLAAVLPFAVGFPRRYQLAFQAEEIGLHEQLAQTALQQGAATALSRDKGVYRLTVCAMDRPGLLATVANELAGQGMNILHAEVYTSAMAIALEVFWFADPHRSLELNPGESKRLATTVLQAAQGKRARPSRPLSRPPARTAAYVRPAVASYDDPSGRCTILEVSAWDQPGLLGALSSILARHNADIEIVLANTEGQRVTDVFYVTHQGRPLSAASAGALRADLLAALP